MKFFKIASVILILAMAPQVGYCQAGTGASKAFKYILKKSGKEAGEETAKKGATKAAKKTVKELTEESAELVINRNASKSLTRTGLGKRLIDNLDVSDNQMVRHLSSSFEKGIGANVGRAFSKEARIGTDIESKALTDRTLINKLGSPRSKLSIEKAGNKELKKGSENAARKKSSIRAGKTVVGEEALVFLEKNTSLKKLVMGMESKYGTLFSIDKLVVKKSGRHTIVEFPGTASKIEVKGNTIFAAGGSTRTNGAMNEFLNNPLPNTTYIVDGCTKYTTDALGKTISVECHSSQLAKSVNRTELAKQNQVELVELKGGKRGVHDSGHIQQHSTGGNNESMNLLPMKATKQRGGKWAKMEKVERDAIYAGSDVINKKKITYKDDGSFIIDVEMLIKDAVTGKISKKQWSFNDLF